MDTGTPTKPQQGAAVIPESCRGAVNAGLQTIKTSMPNVYQSIQARAESMGNDVFQLVRRGLAGQPGCFYAFEAGHVVGTPFGREHPAMLELAQFTAIFGCAHVCIWPATDDEVRAHGTT